eukprot:1722454-Rhodomonas_salina.1
MGILLRRPGYTLIHQARIHGVYLLSPREHLRREQLGVSDADYVPLPWEEREESSGQELEDLLTDTLGQQVTGSLGPAGPERGEERREEREEIVVDSEEEEEVAAETQRNEQHRQTA